MSTDKTFAQATSEPVAAELDEAQLSEVAGGYTANPPDPVKVVTVAGDPPDPVRTATTTRTY